jgi:hypothetical protein
MNTLNHLRKELAEIDNEIRLMISEYEDKQSKTFKFKDQILEAKMRRSKIYESLVKIQESFNLFSR